MQSRNRFAALFVFLILIYPALTTAQIGSLPETLFGAQGLSLGRSAIVSSHDALSASWNPAGMTSLKKITASASWGSLATDDATHTSFGLIIPTNRYGHFGVSFFQMRIGFLRFDEQGQKVGKDTFTHSHLLFTYGRNFSEAFAAGLNVKFIEQNLAGKSATLENPGIDLGLSYRFQSTPFLLQNVAVGIAIDNLVKPVLKFVQLSEALPREARFIAEKAILIGDGKLTLVSNVGFLEYYFHGNKTEFHGGLEYSYKSTIALRAGLHESQFSAGVGLQFKGLIIDYARNNWQVESDGRSSSIGALSLTYQF